MSRTPFLTCIAAAALLLAGCAKDPTPGGLPMQVAPTLAGDAKGGITTSGLTDFYLQVTDADPAYSYFMRVLKDDSGAWTTPTALYWKDEQASVSCTAARFGTHGFTATEFADGLDLELPIDQRTQEQLNSADLLSMSATGVKYEDTAGGVLPVTLRHALVKLNIEVSLENEFYDQGIGLVSNPIVSVTVRGASSRFNFKPLTGVVIPVSPSANGFSPFPSSYTPGTAGAKTSRALYEVILLPQTFAPGALNVKIRVSDVTYDWYNPEETQLEGGNTVTLPIHIYSAP